VSVGVPYVTAAVNLSALTLKLRPNVEAIEPSDVDLFGSGVDVAALRAIVDAHHHANAAPTVIDPFSSDSAPQFSKI
jgi:hypothetical protein